MKVSWALWVAIGALVLGVMLLGGGIAMAVIGGRGRRPPPPEGEPAAGAAPVAAAPAAAGAPPPDRPKRYPVDLTGELDPGSSRWLWLVKWLLLIPHYIVLLFLWIAYFVVTVIAFFAILFTARYPRPLFDFTTGVLRWSWRVGFYGYSALGTDRYPPFSLERTDHPARIDVALPRAPVARAGAGQVVAAGHPAVHRDRDLRRQLELRLGRGVGRRLGLVERLVVLRLGPQRRRADRHPGPLRRHRPALHRALPARAVPADVALNRWVYRVVAYVSLMRDEYPPFSVER